MKTDDPLQSSCRIGKSFSNLLNEYITGDGVVLYTIVYCVCVCVWFLCICVQHAYLYESVVWCWLCCWKRLGSWERERGRDGETCKVIRLLWFWATRPDDLSEPSPEHARLLMVRNVILACGILQFQICFVEKDGQVSWTGWNPKRDWNVIFFVFPLTLCVLWLVNCSGCPFCATLPRCGGKPGTNASAFSPNADQAYYSAIAWELATTVRWQRRMCGPRSSPSGHAANLVNEEAKTWAARHILYNDI